ncbi:MAG: isoleucine--tRNA ligase [Halanaerobiales bacterium]
MKKEQGRPNFINLEKSILNFWEENDSFKKLQKKNQGNKRFRFLDGPITANNEMGIHHVWGRTLKDLYIKYKSMKGYSCHFRNGFDAHGTPVEVNVEKQLNIKNKKELKEYGIGKFVDKCLDRVDKYSNIQTQQSKRLGQWMDWENSYYTNTDENITSIWHFLKKTHEKGWLKLSNKPMMWCPRCGTSLSDHEMTGSYKETVHEAVFSKLPLKNSDSKILLWTTTPWTLSSNVALAVNPENTYIKVKVKSDDSPIILGKEALKTLKSDVVEVLEEFKGKELLDLEYETCFPELDVQKFTHKIVPWEDVEASEGTGVVHIAPGCGQEDYDLGEELGLRKIAPINENGEFIKGFDFLTGLDVKQAKSVIFDKLKEQNKLYYTHDYSHNYPVCWRCKEEIVFRLIDSWSIDVDEIRPELIKAAQKVEWEPEYLEKSMIDWLENMSDWHISRSRFYGLPLPIYQCQHCGNVHVIGSKEELKKKAVNPEEVDKIPHLHRPYVDKVEIECEKCKKPVKRVTDVGDTWLDAGITPFSTLKYFTDKDYWKENFPAEVVIEMKEQVRLWFYSLLFMSVTLEGRPPYERVMGHSAVVQEDGSKFSKSGFMIRLDEAAEKIGMDPTRYLYASAGVNNDVRFGYNLGDEVKRKLLGLWNSYTFFTTYAAIDNPDIQNHTPKYSDLNKSDKWLVKLTNNFIAFADKNYNEYKAYNVTKRFESYIDKLTNFYIRVNRRRFWKDGDQEDKINAYWTLYNALKAVTQIMAPIIPFLTEYIWQNLVRQVEDNAEHSVILSDFPEDIISTQNDKILESVDLATDVISVGQRLRAENQIKVKQPLSKIYVKTNNQNKEYINNMSDIIKSELNVKKVEFFEDESNFYDTYLTIDFAKAGRVLKGDVQKAKSILEQADENKMKEFVQEYNAGQVTLGDLGKLDAELFNKNYISKDEFAISQEKEYVFILDKNITPDLKKEGMLRELVRTLQVLRKNANFNITDRIDVQIDSDKKEGMELVNEYTDTIKEEVLINNLNNKKTNDYDLEEKEEISGIQFTIKISKSK